MTALALAALLLAAAAVAWWAGSGWLRWRRASFITVHTTDDRTLDGLLVATARDGIVLDSAGFHASESRISLAGRTWIPRSKISFVQVTDAPPDS